MGVKRSTQRCVAVLVAAGVAVACATRPEPRRYRLASSGDHWDVVNGDRVVDDLLPRYAEFFAVVLDPAQSAEPKVQALRDDLERRPTDRRNYDALNSLAIAYFEFNYRAEAERGSGLDYLGRSFQSAKLLAVPWRAYSVTGDPELRDAILDFFEDAGSGEKLGTAGTAPRVIRIVESLEAKEGDPGRRTRIRSIANGIRARSELRRPLE